MLDDALWVPGMSCAIIAHEQKTLDSIFEIVYRAFNSMPLELRPEIKTDTTRKYYFVRDFEGTPLDSEIYVALKIRGGTVRRLHITESAYIKDRAELKSGAKQAVPLNGYITEETTGNGLEDFYDDYMSAYDKKQKGKQSPLDYNTYFYSWFENPEYILPGTLHPDELSPKEIEIKAKYRLSDGQLLWRRWKMDEMKQRSDGINLNTEQMFMQEYPATVLEAFQSGSGSVFNLEKLSMLVDTTPLDGVDAYNKLHENWESLSAQEQHDNEQIRSNYIALTKLGVKFWHLPEKGHKYILGCDPSDGSGGDNADVDIWDKDLVNGKLRQCAQFFGQMRPDLLAELIKFMATTYNDAFAGVENNMLSTVLFLKDIYDNIVTEIKLDVKTQKRTLKYGINTNGLTRNPMIDEYIQLWEEDGLEINSAITLKQMRTFVRKENGKREHAEGKSDDALFGAFIALQMRRHEPPRARVFRQKAF